MRDPSIQGYRFFDLLTMSHHTERNMIPLYTPASLLLQCDILSVGRRDLTKVTEVMQSHFPGNYIVVRNDSPPRGLIQQFLSEHDELMFTLRTGYPGVTQ
jgi:hypothetical protein